MDFQEAVRTTLWICVGVYCYSFLDADCVGGCDQVLYVV